METRVVAISGGISWNLLCSYWHLTSFLFHNWLQWHKICKSGALFTPLSHHIADSSMVFVGYLSKKGLWFSNLWSAFRAKACNQFLKNEAQRWLVPPLHAHCLTTGSALKGGRVTVPSPLSVTSWLAVYQRHPTHLKAFLMRRTYLHQATSKRPTEVWEGTV